MIVGDDPAVEAAGPLDEAPRRRQRSRMMRRLLAQRGTTAWAIVLVIVVLAAIFAPLLAPSDPNYGDLFRPLENPSGDHWLGTDGLGRDVLSRLLYGARVALLAAGTAVGIALVIGVPIGLVVGYRGGWADRITMRVVDAVISLPFLVVAIALISVLGPGLFKSMAVVGVIYAMLLIRLTRGQVLAAREEIYVDAARVAGGSTRRILLRHIFPNIVPPLIVQVTLMFATAIIAEATLSFLGLGVQSPNASWGGMLATAQESIRQHFFLAIPPGVAIVLTVLALNQVGDGLRDAFAREARGGSLGVHAVRRDAAPATATDTGDAGPVAAHPDPLLRVEDLSVSFPAPAGGDMDVVQHVSFDVGRAEIVGLVGESGSGKSLSAMSLVGLVPDPGQPRARSIEFDGRQLVGLGFNQLRSVRGGEIGVVFQEPMSSLNPAFTVGDQVAEAIRQHRKVSKAAARDRVVQLFEQVRIPDAASRLDDHPHQFSGGMAQRVMIAMALACDPKLLIADEPTTALDVTVQGQVLDLLLTLRHELGMSILIITHDLGVIADVADRVAVMYAGEIVERATVTELFERPRHPYTKGLLDAVPVNLPRVGKLRAIPGVVPPPWEWPDGCHFADRCAFVEPACRAGAVPLRPVDGRLVRCVRAEEIALTAEPTEVTS